MKHITFGFLFLTLASASNAAYISFSPSTVSIPRGAVSTEITLRVSGDYQQTAYVETRLSIPLPQMDFVEMVRGNANSQCIIKDGKLYVDFSLPTFATLPIAVTTMCKFRVRARFSAVPGNYVMTQGTAFSFDIFGNYGVLPTLQNANITVTP